MRSDGISYTGILVNLERGQPLHAVFPANEEVTRGGLSFSGLFEFLRSDPDPKQRSMSFQWLHPVLYYPFLHAFPSLYTIIILNNILLFLSGFLLFRTLAPRTQIIGWLFLCFFPPLFLLTGNFFSEPLFIFLLTLLFTLFQREKLHPAFFLFALLLPWTRPIGGVYVLLFALFFLREKKYWNALLTAVCLAAAIILNGVVTEKKEDSPFVYTPSSSHALYLSNTPNGNGDLDYYLSNAMVAQSDSVFQSNAVTVPNGRALAQELVHQILNNPGTFVFLTVNKIGNMFFGIIPDAWLYDGMHFQSLFKRISWILMTACVWIFIGFGLNSGNARKESLYKLLFFTTALLHLFFVARYRYLLPIVVLGLPAAARGAEVLFKKMKLFPAERAS